ncbi:MAG: serine--tRNA ligase [Deltaproteobacteria bacterium]|jgi:seryl-tRNA synthetase|nr:serine--tRNA ligase [Deltaproteobacteria bacterium]
MLDPRSLAERRDEIAESCRSRGVEADVDRAVALYAEVTNRQTELNEANRRRNEHQKAGKRKLEAEEREAHTAEGRALKEAVARIESELDAARARFDDALLALPNFIHPDVPVGGEEDFAELRRVGEPTAFGFEAVDHLEIGRRNDLLDFEAGARVAGNKFYYLKNGAVLLELALQRYALDILLEDGFTPYVTPDLARPEIVDGIGYNPRGEETQIYSIANADLCLVGTAEITLGGLYADQILDEQQLPLKLAGISHCFRTEAGSAGRESKGLYRVHQFTKVEMFAITRPEDSEAMHEHLLSLEEKIFQGLELPYRVVDIASGDLGAPAYRKFDIEAWMPGRGEGGSYGEVSSASNCTDYQARRLKTRFRRQGSKKNELVHMLNGTAIANSRGILALLENHQRDDGSVGIPKALQPYVGREVIGGAGS